jgi:hypothetical protein
MCMGVVHDVGNFLGYSGDGWTWSQAPWAPYSNFGFVDGYHAPTSNPKAPAAPNNLPKGYAPGPVVPVLDNFFPTTIQGAYTAIGGADSDPTSGIPQGWFGVSKNANDAAQSLREELKLAHENPDAWTGKTADAAYQTINSALPILETISTIAQVLSVLSQTFSSTIGTTKNEIVNGYNNYNYDRTYYPEAQTTIEAQYDTYAQTVMGNYLQSILNIAGDFPSFTTEPTPHVGSPGGGPGGTHVVNANGGGGGTPSGGGGGGGPAISGGGGLSGVPNGSAGGSGTPTNAQLAALKTSNPAQSAGTQQNPLNPAATSAASNPSSGQNTVPYLAEAAPEAMQGLMSPLQQAMSQAGRGAQGATPPGGAGAPKAPPPMKAGDVHPSLKGGGAGGGRPEVMAKTAGLPATAANSAGRTVAAGSRAALSGAPGNAGVGTPAAGAPGGGGQHGAGAQGGPYQPNKVLRSKKNGEEIIGDAEAVVPVLGEPARTEDANTNKPDAT